MKLFLAAGAAAIALTFATTATAGPDFQEMRTQLLLQKLLSGDTGSAQSAKAATTVSAKVRVKGTINRKGSFSLPVWCHVYLYYYDGQDSFQETKSEQAEFSAGTGSCNVLIPFRWKVADDTMDLEVGVQISNGDPLSEARAKAAAFVGRGTDERFPNQPLPAPGTIKVLTFNVDM